MMNRVQVQKQKNDPYFQGNLKQIRLQLNQTYDDIELVDFPTNYLINKNQ